MKLVWITKLLRLKVRDADLINDNYHCNKHKHHAIIIINSHFSVPIQDFLDVSPKNQTVDLRTMANFTCSNPGLESNEFFWIRNHSDPTTVPNVDLIGTKNNTELIMAAKI